jgi:hypothetical protein
MKEADTRAPYVRPAKVQPEETLSYRMAAFHKFITDGLTPDALTADEERQLFRIGSMTGLPKSFIRILFLIFCIATRN